MSAARAAIAAAYLDTLPDALLGDIQLRDDQRRIVARAQRALASHGGCLIGEDVGRGKTFVALALAQRWRAPLVVVPAALRHTWASAMGRAHVSCAVVSHEALSRGAIPAGVFDGMIVDESHHFRTTSTRRYDALCALSAHVPLVLLSATPLQNRTRDLAAQLALFIGEVAFSMNSEQLARFVIRGDAVPIALMPNVTRPEWITLEADNGHVLRALLNLAPPARPLDGGDAGALRTIGLVRAWASSRAALQAMVRARRRMATAIEQGLDAGRTPTRREARAWHGMDDVVQLGFATLLMTTAPLPHTLDDLRSAMEAERRSLALLAQALASGPDPDVARVRALRRLRLEYPACSIIAFSEYASTVNTLFNALRADVGVGVLTARESRIASGRITRNEMLARFAPVAQRVAVPPAHERVTLLLATDLLSEGVNLQDASIVVHLDLPWNPARLAQRVGRVRRPGGAADVRTFLLAPPADAATLLDADARLRRKLVHAEQAIGVGFHVLPVLAGSTPDIIEPRADSLVSATTDGELVAVLARWKRGLPERSVRQAEHREGCALVVSAVESPTAGWLAALDDGRLLASLDGAPPDTLASVLGVARLANGCGRHASQHETDDAIAAVQRWLAAEEFQSVCGVNVGARGPLRRAVFVRLNTIAQALPRYQRAELLPIVATLRVACRGHLSLGIERALARHANQHEVGAQTWLTIAKQLSGRASGHALHESLTPPNIVALVVVGAI